jgi:energy-coupling factor transport system permease protein
MTNVAFGRYLPNVSFTHKMDARNKLLLSIALIVMIFFKFTTWGTTIVMSCAYLLLLIALMIISKVSFIELFKSLKGMWFLVLFLFIVYVFIPNSDYSMGVAFSIGDFKVRWDAFYQSGYIIARLIMMLALMMVLTTTTKPLELTYAFEWYMAPLKVIRFPVHEIAMTLSITLRFIPTLLEETDRIMKAQSSRGVDFSKGGLSKRFKAIISLIIPLFVSSIERSEELANAMEARGYDPKMKRTKYRRLRFTWRDIVSFLVVASLVAGVIVFYWYDRNVKVIDLFDMIFKIQIK